MSLVAGGARFSERDLRDSVAAMFFRVFAKVFTLCALQFGEISIALQRALELIGFRSPLAMRLAVVGQCGSRAAASPPRASPKAEAMKSDAFTRRLVAALAHLETAPAPSATRR